MLATTRKFGYGSYEYDARLAQAEIELQTHSPSAQPHLAALEKDATNHHLLLVASDAHALSQGK